MILTCDICGAVAFQMVLDRTTGVLVQRVVCAQHAEHPEAVLFVLSEPECVPTAVVGN